MNQQRGLLVIIAVLLMGIFILLAVEVSRKSPEDRVADSISKTAEKIGDKIDDHIGN